MTASPLPTYDDVLAAAARIEPYVHRTPVFTSAAIDDRFGGTMYAKSEHLQRVGAFKARGAVNAALVHRDRAIASGIATHSSGNHGQAVAYAATVIGTKATVVMPDHAAQVKVDAIRGYGAEIVFCPQPEREAVLDRVVAETGAHVIHPFDDPSVVAGQGTATLELLTEVAGLDVVMTPIGGGGLMSGASIVANEHGLEVVGAEPEVVDDSHRSLRDGVRYPATGEMSIGDGLLTGIGSIAFEVLNRDRREVVVVSEQEILAAMRYVITRTKQLIEPSSATVFAALFRYPERFAGRRVGVVVSGGNVDLAKLAASAEA